MVRGPKKQSLASSTLQTNTQIPECSAGQVVMTGSSFRDPCDRHIRKRKWSRSMSRSPQPDSRNRLINSVPHDSDYTANSLREELERACDSMKRCVDRTEGVRRAKEKEYHEARMRLNKYRSKYEWALRDFTESAELLGSLDDELYSLKRELRREELKLDSLRIEERKHDHNYSDSSSNSY